MTAEKKPSLRGTNTAALRLSAASSAPVVREPGADLGAVDGMVDGFDIDPAREPMLAAQRGDLDAFRQLIEMFQDRVFRVVNAVLHCDRATAEDLSQEVFLRVHRGLPGFDGAVRFGTWLHAIAMNVAISEHRRRRALKRNRRTTSIDAPLPGTDDLRHEPHSREIEPGERAHHNEFAARVRDCVRELPDEFRDAVILRDMQDLSYEEIASILQLPPGTVRSRIHRGRLLLQQMLQGFLS